MKSIDGCINIGGARTHNLRDINLSLPREKLIVLTGLSGSGKSSLAFDTIYAEGQRRYVESLSAYARQFLSMMEKPDVDHIDGLSPAISIEQKSTSHNPRSTVGTVTEIYDYLRLLFARAGTPRCPDHDITLEAQTVSQMVDHVLELPEGSRLMLLAPVVVDRKGEHVQLMAELQAQGFIRARIDGEIYELDQPPALDLRKKHNIDAIVDRFKVKDDIRLRLAESFETALRLADGVARIAWMKDTDAEEIVFSDRFACNICGYSLTELEPRLFSFNNPSGACPGCDGLGVKQFFDADRVVVSPGLSLAGGAIRGWDRKTTYYYQMIQSLASHYGFDIETPFNELSKKLQDVVLRGSGKEKIEFFYANSRGMQIKKLHRFEGVLPNLERRYRETESSAVREELSKFLNSQDCPDCEGTRLNRAARHVFVAERSLPEITSLSVGHAREFFDNMKLDGWRGTVADKIVKEISERVGFLSDVGLDYLSLDRSAETLSGGEAQRIRLASQIGSGLVGVMYILDEPSIGLHQRDNQRLLGTLTHLRDIGNTVIVVEHDEEAILSADHVVDLGPGAGVHGGQVVAQGTPQEIKDEPRSLTGQYLSGKRAIAVPDVRTPVNPDRQIVIVGATGNNLNPGWPHDLHHRCFRVRQVDARQRHPVQGCCRRAQSGQPEPGTAQGYQGAGSDRSRHRYQPEPYRPHAAFQSGDLQRPVHAHSRAVRGYPGSPFAWLHAGALQLQRQGRPVRSLPGRRRHKSGNALSPGRLRTLRRLSWKTVQPRDAGDSLQGQEHPRSAGHDG